MYELILPNGDRAEAINIGGILLAARTLIREAADAGAASTWLQNGAIVTLGGSYDAAATQAARSGYQTPKGA